MYYLIRYIILVLSLTSSCLLYLRDVWIIFIFYYLVKNGYLFGLIVIFQVWKILDSSLLKII